MAKLEPKLIKIIFEVRYEKGYRYLDRCGQMMVDIEEATDGDWVPTTMTPQSGQMYSVSSKARLNVDPYKFVVFMEENVDEGTFITQSEQVSPYIIRNLGVEDFIRFGCRVYYMIPTQDIEEAEKKIAKSGWVNTSDKFLGFFSEYEDEETENFLSYTLRIESPLPGKESIRVNIASATRAEGEEPSEYLHVSPRSLSKNQREAIAKKAKETKKYQDNPKHGVLVDVDQYIYDTEEPIDISYFIKKTVDKTKELAISISG